MKESTSAEARELLELLRQEVGSAAAAESVRTRGAVRTRGIPIAASRTLEEVLHRASEASPGIRSEVIAALGEQGDPLAAEVLARLAQREPEWRLRLAVVDALARAGAAGVDTLMRMAEEDLSDEVRLEAIRKLGALARSSSASWPAVRARGPRPRGAVRVRGAAPSTSAGLSSEARAILEMLDDLRFRDASERVRNAAEETLADLDR